MNNFTNGVWRKIPPTEGKRLIDCKGLIILGDWGSGKTYLAMNHAGFVEMHRSEFDTDEAFLTALRRRVREGYSVVLQNHVDKRNMLENAKIPFISFIKGEEDYVGAIKLGPGEFLANMQFFSN